jgi:hypothetical protein
VALQKGHVPDIVKPEAQSQVERMAKISNAGSIFLGNSAIPQEKIAFFTSLFQSQSGDNYCVFQLASTKNAADARLGLCVARRGSFRWDRLPTVLAPPWNGHPGSLCIGTLAESKPGQLTLYATWYDRSDPARPLFDPDTEGILHSLLLATDSTDDGQHWGPWRKISTGPLTGCALTGPSLRWPDGSTAMPLESFKHYDEPDEKFHAAWVHLIDKGAMPNAKTLHQIAGDPTGNISYWDQRLTPLESPGEYLALFWTHDRPGQQDLDVHFQIGNAREPDLSSPQSTGISGQIAAPLALSPTHFLALVVDRNGPDPSIVLHQSTDRGESWDATKPLIIYRHREEAQVTQGAENIDYAGYWEDMGKWSFGHPALLAVDQNTVLAAYYAGTPEHMGIHYANIEF